MERKCNICEEVKPLTEEYFYLARPRKNHPKESWQSGCRMCWKSINARNKLRRKNADSQVQRPDWTAPRISFLQSSSEGIVCIVPKDFMHVPSETPPALDEEYQDGEEDVEPLVALRY